MRLLSCEERSHNYSLFMCRLSTYPRSFPCDTEASISGIKRSFPAVVWQNRASWARVRTHFTISSPAHCPFTLDLSIEIYHSTKMMLETQTPPWLQVKTHLSVIYLKLSSYMLICVLKSKKTLGDPFLQPRWGLKLQGEILGHFLLQLCSRTKLDDQCSHIYTWGNVIQHTSIFMS